MRTDWSEGGTERMKQILLTYFIVVNVIAFIMYGVDKWKAKNHKYRIPEKTLIGIAGIGGSIGAWSGMQAFRHKTKHTKFVVGVPVILILQVIAMGVIWYIMRGGNI